MNNVVVSFEKTSNGTKVNTKTRRKSIPGIIEREEMARCEMMELIADLSCLKDERDSWYARKYGD